MNVDNEANPGESKIVRCEHHEQLQVCTTRPPYRQGKEFKAVKVYTVNNESKHVLIHNVPSIGLIKEIAKLASKFGKIETARLIEDYPNSTEFTNVYYVKYLYLKDARQAKKRLDNRSFFGNLLHVCYAPELENKDECRDKIMARINSIQKKSFKPKNSNKGHSAIQTVSVSPASSAEGRWQSLLPSSASKTIPQTKYTT